MYEIPPILTGTAEEQLRQLREWAVRLILRLNEEEKNK